MPVKRVYLCYVFSNSPTDKKYNYLDLHGFGSKQYIYIYITKTGTDPACARDFFNDSYG